MAWAWIALLSAFVLFVLIGFATEALIYYWFYVFGAFLVIGVICCVCFLENMHHNVEAMKDYLYRIHVDTRDTCDAMERVSPPPAEDEDEQDPEQAQPARKKKGKKKNV